MATPISEVLDARQSKALGALKKVTEEVVASMGSLELDSFPNTSVEEAWISRNVEGLSIAKRTDGQGWDVAYAWRTGGATTFTYHPTVQSLSEVVTATSGISDSASLFDLSTITKKLGTLAGNLESASQANFAQSNLPTRSAPGTGNLEQAASELIASMREGEQFTHTVGVMELTITRHPIGASFVAVVAGTKGEVRNQYNGTLDANGVTVGLTVQSNQQGFDATKELVEVPGRLLVLFRSAAEAHSSQA